MICSITFHRWLILKSSSSEQLQISLKYLYKSLQNWHTTYCTAYRIVFFLSDFWKDWQFLQRYWYLATRVTQCMDPEIQYILFNKIPFFLQNLMFLSLSFSMWDLDRHIKCITLITFVDNWDWYHDEVDAVILCYINAPSERFWTNCVKKVRIKYLLGNYHNGGVENMTKWKYSSFSWWSSSSWWWSWPGKQ